VEPRNEDPRRGRLAKLDVPNYIPSPHNRSCLPAYPFGSMHSTSLLVAYQLAHNAHGCSIRKSVLSTISAITKHENFYVVRSFLPLLVILQVYKSLRSKYWVTAFFYSLFTCILLRKEALPIGQACALYAT
jgi:hypothetical protein